MFLRNALRCRFMMQPRMMLKCSYKPCLRAIVQSRTFFSTKPMMNIHIPQQDKKENLSTVPSNHGSSKGTDDGKQDFVARKNNSGSTIDRVKAFMKKYGYLGILVYYSISFASIFGLFLLLKSGVDMKAVYKALGIKESKEGESSDFEKMLLKFLHLDMNSPNTPFIVMAILLNKFLMPFRLTAALFLTPRLHKSLLRFRKP